MRLYGWTLDFSSYRASIHQAVTHLTAKSREVSKPPDLGLDLLNRFEYININTLSLPHPIAQYLLVYKTLKHGTLFWSKPHINRKGILLMFLV